ncbi:YhfT family protein [Shigella flexneri]
MQLRALPLFYAVDYLRPNPMVAAVLGAVVISAEGFLLRRLANGSGAIGRCVMRRITSVTPSNMLMEVALLVGSISQQLRWRVIPDSRSRLPFTSSTGSPRPSVQKRRHRSWQ